MNHAETDSLVPGGRLEIDHAFYTQQARREQARAMRGVFTWIADALSHRTHGVGRTGHTAPAHRAG